MPQSPQPQPMSQEVWRIDPTPVSRRWWRWAIPAAVLLIGVGVFAAVMAGDTGSLSFFGGMGAILVALILIGPWLYDRARRNNPPITSDGVMLAFRKKSVPIGQIARWHASQTMNRVGTSHGGAYSWHGIVTFELSDGSAVQFIVHYLREREIPGLVAALEPWVGQPAAQLTES